MGVNARVSVNVSVSVSVERWTSVAVLSMRSLEDENVDSGRWELEGAKAEGGSWKG